MTYEEVVNIARDAYEYADARQIFEHIAVQVNVTGEGSGIFYIEVAERAVCVEPYDYFDRDAILTMSSETVVALAKSEIRLKDAIDRGLIVVEGNEEKVWKLAEVKLKNRKKTIKKPKNQSV